MNDKQYLGDAVYADWDGMHLILTIENGISVTSRIYLTEDVWASLVDYIERLREKAKEEASHEG